MESFVWDEIDNELTEMTREKFKEWLQESEAVGWPLQGIHEDGVAEFHGERHVAFACYAKTAEEAHAKLLKHKVYLELNETEA